MQRGIKLLVVAVFIVSILAVGSNLAKIQAQSILPDSTSILAEDNLQIVVIIDQAYYADYDEDGMDDDIITSFRVLVADGGDYIIGDDSGVNYVIDIQTELILPSGDIKTYGFQITTQNGVGITLGWINYVTESGWYDFTVNAICLNIVMDSSQDSVTFDPPGDPGDTPVIDIVLKQL
ncbi:MAG: hypothetical protein P1Q69_14220 [Candidatus Thorarchaeota archaeon]|nr:hypothetical protein [Candidatus Thorarchaeota archaeon]